MHMAIASYQLQQLSNIPHTTLTRYGELDRPHPQMKLTNQRRVQERLAGNQGVENTELWPH